MILVVGLSPAWQRTLVFERFVAGAVNRARRVTETGSGKGVNVASVARQLGAPVRLLTVAGGSRGKRLAASLRRKGIPATLVRVGAETRFCQTLLDGRTMTELVEEGGALTRGEVAAVMAAFGRAVRRARVLALSGSVPAGCGDDFYARLTREAMARGGPVLVDAQRAQLWNAAAQRPLMVKVNREELAAATGRGDVRRGVRALQRRGAQWVAVSHGADAVLVCAPGGAVTVLRPPRVKSVNPIGSGDAMLAGIATGVLRGWPMLAAVEFGIACGAANATTAEPGWLGGKKVSAGRGLSLGWCR